MKVEVAVVLGKEAVWLVDGGEVSLGEAEGKVIGGVAVCWEVGEVVV